MKFFFRENLAFTRDDLSVYVAVVPIGHERHELRFPIKVKRRVLEYLYETERRGADGFQLFDRLRDARHVGKFQESADRGIDRMNAPSGHERREEIPSALRIKPVVEQLMLRFVVLVEIKESVLSENIRHGEKIEMEGVVADHEAVHCERAEHFRLRRWF